MDSNKPKTRHLVIRYLTATFGLFLVALGIALSIDANLGTSPLSCPAYVLKGVWGLSIGNWNIVINTSYIIIQLAVLRKNFKLKYLMQIPASIVFGYLIDFCLLLCRGLHPGTFAVKVAVNLIACAVTALGVSIEVIAKAWMLSAEMTVYAISSTIHKPFGNIKVAMDSTVLVAAAVLSFIMFRNPFGHGAFNGIVSIALGTSEGVVIGLGTVMLALLAGALMRFTDPVADRFMDWVISREVNMEEQV